jgi:hypothetical protein
MKKFFGTGTESPEQLLDMLSANADTITEGNYFRKATPEELQEAHMRHTQLSIDLRVLEGEKETFMVGHKAKVKPLSKEASETLTLLTNKGSIEKGQLFTMIDRVEGQVGVYNQSGELVDLRMATPAELGQTNIIGAIKQANGGFID